MAPSLREIETLVVVDRSGSFVEAARRLGISQSAVSMQIRALEAELGVTLFDRSVRPPLPTPVALAILPTARDVVARVTEIRRVTDAASRPAGLLRLGAISTATLALIPDVLARILRRHPGLGVSVETALSQDLVQRVLDRKLDCAVVTTPEMPPEELRCQAVIRERLVVVAAVGEPVTRLADVATRPFIRYARHQGVGILVGRLLREHGLDPAEFVELDSVESILAMVAWGLGVAIVPELSLTADIRRRIAPWPIDHPGAERAVSLVSRIDSPRGVLLDSVFDDLRSAANDH